MLCILALVSGCFAGGPSESDSAQPPTASPAGKHPKTKAREEVKKAPILERGHPPRKPGKKPEKSKRYWVRVLRVIDGVTFSLDNQGVVRLIGVQPPRGSAGRAYREFFARVTTPAVRRIVEGKRVYLMRDKVFQGRDGRPVIYMFLEDRTMLNMILIQKGYGRVTQEVPFKFQDEFRLWEREARNIGLGFWGRVGN